MITSTNTNNNTSPLPIELLNSVFVYYVDKNNHPHNNHTTDHHHHHHHHHHSESTNNTDQYSQPSSSSTTTINSPTTTEEHQQQPSSSSTTTTTTNRYTSGGGGGGGTASMPTVNTNNPVVAVSSIVGRSSSPPLPFNLNEVMNSGFHYFYNQKFKIGSTMMAYGYNAFPMGISIKKIEEGRFGNSLFLILFENGDCFLIEKHNIHKIQINQQNEKIIDISTTENHFICCSKRKVYHIKSTTTSSTAVPSSTTVTTGSSGGGGGGGSSSSLFTLNEIKGLNLQGSSEEQVKKIETGRKFLLLLTTSGRIFAFGMNKQKQFGSNLEEQLKTLTEINTSLFQQCESESASSSVSSQSLPLFIDDIRADYDHTLLLARNGSLWMCGISVDNPKYKYNYEHFTCIDRGVVEWIFFRGNTLIYAKQRGGGGNSSTINRTATQPMIVSIGQEMPSPNFIYYPTALFFKFPIGDDGDFYGYRNQFMFQNAHSGECYYFSTVYGLIKMDDLNQLLERYPYLKPRFYCSSSNYDCGMVYFELKKVSYMVCGLREVLKSNKREQRLTDVVIKF